MPTESPRTDSAPHEPPRRLVLDLLAPAFERASIDPCDIDDSFNLIDTGVVDSIEFLDLVARIEERAGVQLDLFDADPDVLTTIGGLVQLLEEATGPPHLQDKDAL